MIVIDQYHQDFMNLSKLNLVNISNYCKIDQCYGPWYFKWKKVLSEKNNFSNKDQLMRHDLINNSNQYAIKIPEGIHSRAIKPIINHILNNSFNWTNEDIILALEIGLKWNISELIFTSIKETQILLKYYQSNRNSNTINKNHLISENKDAQLISNSNKNINSNKVKDNFSQYKGLISNVNNEKIDKILYPNTKTLVSNSTSKTLTCKDNKSMYINQSTKYKDNYDEINKTIYKNNISDIIKSNNIEDNQTPNTSIINKKSILEFKKNFSISQVCEIFKILTTNNIHSLPIYELIFSHINSNHDKRSIDILCNIPIGSWSENISTRKMYIRSTLSYPSLNISQFIKILQIDQQPVNLLEGSKSMLVNCEPYKDLQTENLIYIYFKKLINFRFDSESWESSNIIEKYILLCSLLKYNIEINPHILEKLIKNISQTNFGLKNLLKLCHNIYIPENFFFDLSQLISQQLLKDIRPTFSSITFNNILPTNIISLNKITASEIEDRINKKSISFTNQEIYWFIKSISFFKPYLINYNKMINYILLHSDPIKTKPTSLNDLINLSFTYWEIILEYSRSEENIILRKNLSKTLDYDSVGLTNYERLNQEQKGIDNQYVSIRNEQTLDDKKFNNKTDNLINIKTNNLINIKTNTLNNLQSFHTKNVDNIKNIPCKTDSSTLRNDILSNLKTYENISSYKLKQEKFSNNSIELTKENYIIKTLTTYLTIVETILIDIIIKEKLRISSSPLSSLEYLKIIALTDIYKVQLWINIFLGRKQNKELWKLTRKHIMYRSSESLIYAKNILPIIAHENIETYTSEWIIIITKLVSKQDKPTLELNPLYTSLFHWLKTKTIPKSKSFQLFLYYIKKMCTP